MTPETSAKQVTQGEQDDGEPETEEDGTIDAGEMQFASHFGWVAGYFILSGSIATFIYLRWLGVAPAIASAIEPLGSAAVGILGVISFMANYLLMGLLLLNAEGVKDWFVERGLL